MDWVIDFYAKQDAWSGVYTGANIPREYDRERAECIAQIVGDRVASVLELGAGGGLSALATAQRGYHVTALELVPSAAAHAHNLTPQAAPGSLRIIEGDFHTVTLDEQFDVIAYWDGFGVGNDADQHQLLRRIAAWLKPGGHALIDINTPWYWAAVAAGQRMTTATFIREYSFDADNCRLLDRWWSPEHESEAVTQSLRCYSPADLRMLLRSTGLVLITSVPGGAVDYATKTYQAHVPLEHAMQYRAVLRQA